MRSNLVEDAYIYKTHDGIFRLITKKGRNILKKIKREVFQNINNFISDAIIEKNEIGMNTNGELELEINEKDFTKKGDVILEKAFNISGRGYANLKKAFKLTIGDEHYFVKIVYPLKNEGFNIEENMNTYQEGLGLLYAKKILQEKIDKYNNSQLFININILEPIYSTFNKPEKKSVAIYPYLDGYKSFYTEIWGNEDELNKDEKNEILKITRILKNTLETSQHPHITIADIFEDKNILFKKENGKIQLYLTDPYIILVGGDNNDDDFDFSRIVHKLFSTL